MAAKKVRLIPLTSEGSELLRVWRNHDRHAFVDNRYISKKNQAVWFKKLQQNPNHKMYIITYRRHPVGAIGIKLDDTFNPNLGPYILGDKRYLHQGLILAAVKTIFKLHPAPRYHGLVKKSNPAALHLDQKVGFKVIREDRRYWYIERQTPLPKNHPPIIPLLRPSCSSAEVSAVTNVLKSGWWGLGPVTAQFEAAFARFSQAKFAIAVNSATSALHVSVHILKQRYPKKTNIVVPALTFVSTAAVGIYEGLQVRFADIDFKTLCLDPTSVANVADANTLAVIPVHYAGHLAPTNYRLNTPVIEDCAHAAGTPGAGQTGILACWSFHAVKNIAMGDGGMITTNDPDLAKQLKSLRWMGIDQDTWARESKGYNWEYQIHSLGFKYHLNDIQAAIGFAQLKRLPILNRRRTQIAARYRKHLKNLPLTLPPPSGSNHLFPILLKNPDLRNPFIDFMRRQGISIGVHYQPLHHYPVFNWSHPLPVTDNVFARLSDLPIFPDMTVKDQNRVIKTAKQFFATHPKTSEVTRDDSL